MLDQKEIYDFDCNPVEHIWTQHDVTFTFFSAKSSALDMINYFVKYKSNISDPDPPPHMFNFLKFIEENLDTYED